MKRRHILIDCSIIIIVILFLFIANKVFMIKDNNFYNYYNYMQQKKNSIDILTIGSSHAMNAIDSEKLDAMLEESGMNVKSFSMTVTGLRFETMEYRLKEALKTQKPQLIIIETFSAVPIKYSNPDVTRCYGIDYMPLTVNKIQYINKYIDNDKEAYIFPLIRYHYRWNELKKSDFQSLSNNYLREISKDYGIRLYDNKVVFDGNNEYFKKDYSECYEVEPLEPDVENALCGILDTAKENNIKVLLLCLPFEVQMDYSSERLVKNNNYIENKYCNGDDVVMLDLNKHYKELEWNYEYMQDEGHVNGKGSDVLMPVIAKYISENYSELE